MSSIVFTLMLTNLKSKTFSEENKSKINKKKLIHLLNLFLKSIHAANRSWNSRISKIIKAHQHLRISTNRKSHSRPVKTLLTSISRIKVQKRFSRNFTTQVSMKIEWIKPYKKLHKKSKINILSILNFLLEPKEWPEIYQIYKADWNFTL